MFMFTLYLFISYKVDARLAQATRVLTHILYATFIVIFRRGKRAYMTIISLYKNTPGRHTNGRCGGDPNGLSICLSIGNFNIRKHCADRIKKKLLYICCSTTCVKYYSTSCCCQFFFLLKLNGHDNNLYLQLQFLNRIACT